LRQKDWMLDHLIKEAIDRDLQETPAPPLSKAESWKLLQPQLQHTRNCGREKAQAMIKKISIAVVLLAFMLSVVVWQTNTAYALDWFSRTFSQIKGTVTQLFVSNGPSSSDNELPSVGQFEMDASPIHYEDMDLHKAQEKTVFVIVIPKHIPAGYSLRTVKAALVEGDKCKDIELSYENGKHFITIREIIMDGRSSMGLGVDNEDTTVQPVSIGNLKGNLLLLKNGHRQIIWSNDKLQFVIESSSLSEQDLLRLANDM
jgi:hypothetical protein